MRLNFVQDKRCNSAYSPKIMFRARLPERHALNFTHYQYVLQGHSGANVKPYSENNEGLCTPSLITQEFARATSGDLPEQHPVMSRHGKRIWKCGCYVRFTIY